MDHDGSSIDYVRIMSGLCTDYLWAMDRPCMSMSGLCMDYVWIRYGFCTNYVWIMYRLCMDSVSIMYGSCAH